jgi:hypothetical protein
VTFETSALNHPAAPVRMVSSWGYGASAGLHPASETR